MNIDIKPYSLNAKRHPDKQVELIADSIIRFGWQQPIVVDANNEIIVGHGRYLAWKLKHTEMDEPWVTNNEGITLNGKQGKELTEYEVKAYRLADNKIAESDWDMDLVIEELDELDSVLAKLTGFDLSAELADLDEEKELTEAAVEEAYEVIVTCKDEAEQEEVYNKLTKQGLSCRVLTL